MITNGDLNNSRKAKNDEFYTEYEVIEKEFNNMKFDVIIGNPPYQIEDGGGAGDSAVPLYNKFVEKAIELNPKYISMIVPSRWMKGGKGLSSFRKSMINDKRIKHITDYQEAKEAFPTVNLDGGVCYFVWDHKHDDKLNYIYNDIQGNSSTTKRYLKNKYSETVFRDFKQLSIIEKTVSNEKFSKVVSRNPFGIGTDLFNNPGKYPDIKIKNVKDKNYLLIFGVLGNKGGAKRVEKYIYNRNIKKGLSSVNKYKLFYSKSYTITATIPPEVIKGHPGTVSTETFLKIGDFDTEYEMENCLSYMDTKFFRALLSFNRASFNISKGVFELIPLQDFSKPWTDAELYKKYKLTQEEIDYIEDNIKSM